MSFLRTRYLNLIAGRTRGVLADLLRGMLSLLSVPYLAVIVVRNAYYTLLRRSRRLQVPVISIGNITVGGTGKTPVAALVANMLADRGRRTALILRGYKGKAIQFDEERRNHAAKMWRKESDEALVLKRRCPDAGVFVNPNRLAAAQEAIDRRHDAIVLDDAFQHRRVARNLDIVLVDATRPFGYGHLLPRGLLREPSRSLRRADLVILTRSDQIGETDRTLLLRRLKRVSNDAPIVRAVHRITSFTDIKGMPVDDVAPADMHAIVFAGIANFESFRQSVQSRHINIAAAYEYPDHHDYTHEEIDALRDVAVGLEANVILTTEKDAVKLVGRWSDDGCRLLVLRLDIEFVDDGESILAEAIDSAIAADAPFSPRPRG